MRLNLEACRAIALLLASAFANPTSAGEQLKNKERNDLKEFTGFASCAAVSPDGKMLALGGNGWGQADFLLLDVASGRKIWTSSGHRFGVCSVAFSPDSKMLATGDGDGKVSLWTAATGGQAATLVGHKTFVCALQFTETQLISLSGGNFVILWDLKTAKAKATFRYPFRDENKGFLYPRLPAVAEADAKLNVEFKDPVEQMRTVKLSPDGKTLAAACEDNEVRLWSPVTGKELPPLKTDHKDGVATVRYSPDGALLATGGGPDDGTIRLWDVKTRRRLVVLEGHTDDIHDLAFTPDGKTLLSASCDGTLRVWDLRDLTKTTACYERNPSGDGWWPNQLLMSPDGKWFITIAGRNCVKRYSVAEGKELPIGK